MTMSETAWTTARTIDALRRHFKWSDRKLAERVSATGGSFARATVQQRRSGRSPMTLVDVDRFALAFAVPTTILLTDAANALRWVLDHEDEVALQHRLFDLEGPPIVFPDGKINKPLDGPPVEDEPESRWTLAPSQIASPIRVPRLARTDIHTPSAA